MSTTRFNGQIIAEDGRELKDAGNAVTCGGCVFEEDSHGCLDHACTAFELPDEHPLRNANLIWIKVAA